MNSDFKRRKDDDSWIKSHHLFVSFIAIFIGVTAYVFTTFATIQYVRDEDTRLKEASFLLRSEMKDQNSRIESDLKELKGLVITMIRERRRSQ